MNVVNINVEETNEAVNIVVTDGEPIVTTQPGRYRRKQWDDAADESQMIALTKAKPGDWVIRTDLSAIYELTGSDPTEASDWTLFNYQFLSSLLTKLSELPLGWLSIALSDINSDLAVSDPDAVENIFFPEAVSIAASGSIRIFCDKDNPPTGSSIEIDILKNGVSIFTTRPTIDAGEWDSNTAATPYELTTNPDAIIFLTSDEVEFIIKAIGSTNPGKALRVQLLLVKQ